MERPIPLLALSMAAGILGVAPGLLAMAALALIIWDRRATRAPTPRLREGILTLALIVVSGLLGTSLIVREAGRVEDCAAAAGWMDGRERTFEGVVTEAPLPTRKGWRMSVRLDEPDDLSAVRGIQEWNRAVLK
ncbi:MAG: hypothetical protein HQ559_00025 [Lentisphaerae bacterium]|nr:hypothetical protein [Lentisphaerota bacterium]